MLPTGLAILNTLQRVTLLVVDGGAGVLVLTTDKRESTTLAQSINLSIHRHCLTGIIINFFYCNYYCIYRSRLAYQYNPVTYSSRSECCPGYIGSPPSCTRMFKLKH